MVSATSGLSQLLVAGHSRVAEGAATMEDMGVSHKTARRLQASLALLAQGGSCLASAEGDSIAGAARYGGIGRLLQFVTSPRTAAPDLPAWQASILDYGLNDMAWMGPTTFAAVFPLALTSAIQRMRASRIFEDTDASVAYTGASWATFGITTCNSGNLLHTVATNGQSLTITVPSDFPGGTIALRFVTAGNGNGALWTITGTGCAAAVNTTHETRNINGFDNGSTRAATGRLLNSVKRLTGLPAGAGTITVTATTIQGNGFFDCWEIESPYAGPIAAGMDARPATYSLWSTWPYSGIGDSDVTTIWNAINTVVSQFSSGVAGLSIDSVFNKNAAYFAADGAHWNDLGHALAADAIATALGTQASQLQLTEAGGLFVPYFYPLDGTGAGNAFLNSWTYFSSTPGGGYRKDNLTGRVQLKFWASKTTGSATDPIFTLPVGYRPKQTVDFPIAVYNGSVFSAGIGRVGTNGSVQTLAGGSIAAGSTNEFNFSFQAEQ